MAITYEDVCRQAEKLRAEGKSITVTNLRASLGGGSMTTLAPLLKQWKAEQIGNGKDEQQTQLSSTLIDAIKKLIEKEVSEQILSATSNLTAEVAGKDADVEAAQQELNELSEKLKIVIEQKSDLERKNAKLVGSQEESYKQIQNLQSQNSALTDQYNKQSEITKKLEWRIADAEQAIADKESLKQQLSEMSKKISEVEAKNEILNQDAEYLRELQRALPGLQAKADRFLDLEKRVSEKNEEIAEAKKKIEELQELLSEQKVNAAESSASASSAATVIDTQRRQIEDLQKDKQVLSEKVMSLEQEIKEIRKERSKKKE